MNESQLRDLRTVIRVFHFLGRHGVNARFEDRQVRLVLIAELLIVA
jgi:hypothetical protein